MDKQLNVVDFTTAKATIPDLQVWGDVDTWRLLAKASSEEGKWMKSTKAMQIDGLGCVVQVTTQQGDNIAEALTFVPFATIVDVYDEGGKLTARRLDVKNMENTDD